MSLILKRLRMIRVEETSHMTWDYRYQHHNNCFVFCLFWSIRFWSIRLGSWPTLFLTFLFHRIQIRVQIKRSLPNGESSFWFPSACRRLRPPGTSLFCQPANPRPLHSGWKMHETDAFIKWTESSYCMNSEVSERADECSRMGERSKEGGRCKWVSGASDANKWTSEWPSNRYFTPVYSFCPPANPCPLCTPRVEYAWNEHVHIWSKKSERADECSSVAECGRSKWVKGASDENKAGYTAQDAPSMRTFHLQK